MFKKYCSVCGNICNKKDYTSRLIHGPAGERPVKIKGHYDCINHKTKENEPIKAEVTLTNKVRISADDGNYYEGEIVKNDNGMITLKQNNGVEVLIDCRP